MSPQGSADRGLLPVVAMLAARWEAKSEEGWTTRQVAGALANVADVHIITPDGKAGESTDSVFTVHHLGTPISQSLEFRRDLLIEALAASGPHRGRPTSPKLSSLLNHGLIEPWRRATTILETVRPDIAVIAGHQHVGALTAIDHYDPSLPVSLLALSANADSLGLPQYGDVFERAGSVMAVTETERALVADQRGNAEQVHRIGTPLAANASALSEPNPWVGSSDYILILTDTGSADPGEETQLSRLVSLRFPEIVVGISHSDGFFVWHEGRLSRGLPVERSSDLDRLMAWAHTTVDLHPGRFFARRCVMSLLYGTPIVVPSRSLAREHAELGNAGLWFAEPAELVWGIEALLDPSIRGAFSTQGRSYAEQEYGSTDVFIKNVLGACGLDSDQAESRVIA